MEILGSSISAHCYSGVDLQFESEFVHFLIDATCSGFPTIDNSRTYRSIITKLSLPYDEVGKYMGTWSAVISDYCTLRLNYRTAVSTTAWMKTTPGFSLQHKWTELLNANRYMLCSWCALICMKLLFYGTLSANSIHSLQLKGTVT